MELSFLTIADAPEDLQPLRGWLAAFEREKKIQLSLRRVGWDRAWQALLMAAVERKRPHVAQIGSTWVATMTMTVGLAFFQQQLQAGAKFTILMAGAFLSIMPLLMIFFIAQKQFIEGIALSGVKR